jgi:hypothetical protein
MASLPYDLKIKNKFENSADTHFQTDIEAAGTNV